ncbi:MAG: hypothetical protein HOP12_14075 [Candidatus Eisenbacteria bacterium]|uniref:Uncharacterized protein n=1 Tax=Eiseniibacteriota bacterium TaxID=2212470 RepID=A0A849SQQ0_UNCEI|nr:hypothetical protein [Candidatus Eisenbacteria bacterium]
MKPTRPRRRKKVTTVTEQDPRGSRIVAIADSHLAAATAQRLATISARWAKQAGAGEDDALEVVAAAQRAREAASHAEDTETTDDAWAAARLAWAAVTSAREADERVKAAIAQALSEIGNPLARARRESRKAA